MKTKTPSAFVLALSLVASLAAGGCADMHTAKRAAELGDYDTARRHYETLADIGVPEAKYELGRMYYSGKGVDKNLETARLYFEDAARGENNVRAQDYLRRTETDLGIKAVRGEKVGMAPEEGVEILRRAAAAKDARALYELGQAYEKGSGVAKDGARALKYYQEAGAAGNPQGYFNGGRLLEKGEILAQDHIRAAQMYEMAIEAGFPRAHLNLGRMYENGKGVQQNHAAAIAHYERARAAGLDVTKDLDRARARQVDGT